jgi:hypothetical protein
MIGRRIPPKQVRIEHESRTPGLELYCLQQAAPFEPGTSRSHWVSQCCCRSFCTYAMCCYLRSKAVGVRVLEVEHSGGGALLGTALLDWRSGLSDSYRPREDVGECEKPLRRNCDKKAPRAVICRQNVADNRRCRRGEALIQRKAY